MTNEEMTPAKIDELHSKVQEIKQFQNQSHNSGFDQSLISAAVTPKKVFPDIDFLIIFLVVFAVLFFTVFLIKSFTKVPEELEILLLLGSIMLATFIAFLAHLRFDNGTGTLVLCCGLALVIAIGFEVITPREAFDKAAEKVE